MTFTIHRIEERPERRDLFVLVRLFAVDKARVLEAWAGKFTLPIQLGTSSTPRTSIGFHRLLTKRPSRSQGRG